MESTDPHPRRLGVEQPVNAIPHLLGRLVGEGDGHDQVGVDPVVLDEMCDAAGKDTRLAGAGTCEHEKGALDVLDRLSLLQIQRI
jgi:hypothetical protein